MGKYKQSRWDLKDVLPANSGPLFDAIISELNGDVTKFEALKEDLSTFDKDDMKNALELKEKISETVSRLGVYAGLLFSEDTQNQENKVFKDNMEKLYTDVANKMLFFDLWWTKLDDNMAGKLVPENEDHRYYLGKLRKLRPYILDEKVEQAINLKNMTGTSAWVAHYDQLTNGFSFTVRIGGKALKTEEGKTRKFTRDELAMFFTSSDAAEREAAHKSILKKYAEHGNALGEIYKNIVKDWHNENIGMRHYKSPISVRNMSYDIPDEAADALLSVCRKNAGVFQKFFKIKADILGIKKMPRYDIFAPLSQSSRTLEYSDAVDLILDTLGSFDEGVGRMSRDIFEKNHVDSETRHGKMAGGFTQPVTPKIMPYYMENYVEGIDGAFNAIHEVSHNDQFQMCSGHSILVYDIPLPMAETASMFGEMLLLDKIMESEPDINMKKGVLAKMIDELYKYVHDASFTSLFEKAAHEAVANGATVDDLCNIYLSNLKEKFGDSVYVPEEFKWGWTAIPHIYQVPFYMHSYAFGNLMALALYKRYKTEGEPFKGKYLKILSYGGSASPEKILGEVGIDIRSPDFWQSGFDAIRDMVDQLERM